MRIVVTGVPGVGKSTIMDGVSRTTGMKIVNYGDVMLEIAKGMGVKNRDEIRKLPAEKQREIQRRAGEEIGKMDDVIIDTHMSIKTPSGYLPGLPEWVLREIKPSMLVLIEANPEDIYSRRSRDTTRARDNESQESIRIHQEINRSFAASCSVLSGATVVIIKNEEGKVDKAVNDLVSMIKHD